ncbi:hypothetical protein [Chlamydia sp. 17-3921]|uniref:hypothetical protein n=1 Tax=Chlamydia sp. 17-3921 TaxID=2675798 RepID=UPI001918DCBC|nr:hypothetical protein [Chlamydia sp. 17-3921]
MKFPHICFEFVTKPSFSWLKGNNKIFYLQNSKLITKKLVSAVLFCLGLSLLGCAAFSMGVCQTFLPAVALILVAFCLFILAYYQYVKGWAAFQLPTVRKTITQVDWASFLSSLRLWDRISIGGFRHPTKTLYIYEGSPKILQSLLRKRRGENNGVFLIQELDHKAIRCHCEETETLAQQAFDLPQNVKNSLRQNIEQSGATSSPLTILWNSPSEGICPEGIICVDIPNSVCMETLEEKDELNYYSWSYFQGFLAAIDKATTSPVVKEMGICILTPILGVSQNLSVKETNRKILLSKIAFLQAAERLASESILPLDKALLPITLVLTDPCSVSPLSSSQLKLDYSAIDFADIGSEECFCCVM